MSRYFSAPRAVLISHKSPSVHGMHFLQTPYTNNYKHSVIKVLCKNVCDNNNIILIIKETYL